MVDIADQLIPHFPPEYLPQNRESIDFCNDFAACATGFCVHFFYLKGKQITRAYSFPISTISITSLRFHPSTNQLAVGNSRGTVFLFDIHKRTVIARASSTSRDDDSISSLQWNNNELYVLYKSQKLSCLSYSPTFSDTTKQLSHFVCLWTISLPAPYTRMSLDPQNHDKILLSGSGAAFSVFKLSETGGPPTTTLKLVTLNGAGDVNDASWSIHLPNYIFLLTDTELFIFDTATQGITAITQHKRSASSFSTLMQFATNDKKMIIFHKSGTMSVLKVEIPPFKVSFAHEITYKHRNQTYINYAKDSGNDDYVILWFVPLGLCTFDINKERTVSMCQLEASGITSFDTDGISIVYGTKKGNVIYSDLFDLERGSIFNVSNDSVTFVSLCPARNRIFWHTPSRIGVVDLTRNQNQLFSSRASPVTKAVGSFQGCLIVQRAPSVLGIFIDDIERPILLSTAAIDFCFNESNASFDEGEFAILHENKDVIFYKYNSKTYTPSFKLQKAFSSNSTPICIAWKDHIVVIGTLEGNVNAYQFVEKEGKKKIVLSANNLFSHSIKKLTVSERTIFGLTSENELFVNVKEPIFCNMKVVQFYPVSPELVLTLSPSGYLQFLTSPKFSQLSKQSKLLPLPSEQLFLTEKLKDPTKEHYFTIEARDIWSILHNQVPLRLKAMAAASDDSAVYEEIVYTLLNQSNVDPSKKMELSFPALLYANRFTEASDALLAVDVNEDRFLYCILLASLAIGFDKKIGEKQKTRLKMSALALLTSEKFDDGAMLLRLARLDKAAVEYLLESQQLEIAMRFVRSSLEGEEKKEMMLRCGGFLLQKGNMRRAALFFAGCGEFHPLLFVMLNMQKIPDAFFIKRYAVKNNLMKPLSENMSKAVGTIMPLDELSHVIDAEFKSLLYHLDIDTNLYFDD